MDLPKCPKCGTAAQNVLMQKPQVRCRLNNDGSVGKVLSYSRSGEIVGYECGGGHTWKTGLSIENPPPAKLETPSKELLELMLPRIETLK